MTVSKETIAKPIPSPTPDMNGWMPIETAPKDGMQFLAYEDGNHYALEWKQEMPGPDGGYWVCHCGQYVTIPPEPTHWMPLPAAPVTP